MGTPRTDEQFAYGVVARTLHVSVNHYDQDGRQAAVDALIDLPTGHVGALEVTSIGDPEAFRSEAEISKVFGGRWTVPGLQWYWAVWVQPGVRPAELEARLPDLLARCEAAGIKAPDQLDRLPVGLEWFARDDVKVTGMPDTNLPGLVQVMPDLSGAGAAPSDGDALGVWVDTCVLTDPGIERHLVKLLAFPADEHHLFVRVSHSALDFVERYVLEFSVYMPSPPPAVPPDLDGLWLCGRFGQPAVWRRTVGWTRPEIAT